MTIRWKRGFFKAIVTSLTDRAKFNQKKAYAMLGAEPGPGYDLLIRPVEPLCGKWHVEGLTQAGLAFVEKVLVMATLVQPTGSQAKKAS